MEKVNYDLLSNDTSLDRKKVLSYVLLYSFVALPFLIIAAFIFSSFLMGIVFSCMFLSIVCFSDSTFVKLSLTSYRNDVAYVTVYDSLGKEMLSGEFSHILSYCTEKGMIVDNASFDHVKFSIEWEKSGKDQALAEFENLMNDSFENVKPFSKKKKRSLSLVPKS